MTGHGFFRAYLTKMNIINNSLCQCLEEAQTGEHLLFNCKLTEDMRVIVKRQFESLNIHSITDIFNNDESKQLILSMTHSIYTRFNCYNFICIYFIPFLIFLNGTNKKNKKKLYYFRYIIKQYNKDFGLVLSGYILYQ